MTSLLHSIPYFGYFLAMLFCVLWLEEREQRKAILASLRNSVDLVREYEQRWRRLLNWRKA